MWIFKQTIPPGLAIVAPRGPLAVEEGGYGWFWRDESELEPEVDALWAGRDHLHRFLSRLPQQYPLDSSRLVLMGFSQGAALCNTLAITQPGVVMGVASLAGFVPKPASEAAKNGSLESFPVFIAHGIRDETVPLAAAQESREIYTHLGAQVRYGEYPTGHKLTPRAMADLKQWLAQIIGPVRAATLGG
jgi:phospholipase/carboxylesterase